MHSSARREAVGGQTEVWPLRTSAETQRVGLPCPMSAGTHTPELEVPRIGSGPFQLGARAKFGAGRRIARTRALRGGLLFLKKGGRCWGTGFRAPACDFLLSSTLQLGTSRGECTSTDDEGRRNAPEV